MNGIRRWVWALGVLSVLPLSMPIAAAVDGARVQMAIAKGAEFLRKTHTPAPGYTGGTHGLGQSALAGIALLEAGVSPKDPSLQQIAQFVRIRGLSENRTYHLSLSIIFLDLLHDTHDHGLIQVMGIRLYHGLNVAGGWTYDAWDNIPETEARRLAAVLYPPRKTAAQPELRTPAASTGFPTVPPRATPESPPARLHPEAVRQLRAVRNAMTVTGRRGVGDDNSNTQFGIIGLWVATRHGLAVDDAFALIETRFLRSQNPTDGGWAYSGTGASTPAMTCAGLLGLAVGAAIRESRTASLKTRPTARTTAPDDPFFHPKTPRTEKPEAPPRGQAPPKNAREAAVSTALTAIGGVLATTQREMATSGGTEILANFVGHGNPYYVLWSIERVAVAYDLQTIGNVDWYEIAAQYLLPAQNAGTGAWHHAIYDDDINTAFAILILKKANFISELTGKIRDKVSDPGRAELRAGGAAPLLFAPPTPAPKRLPPPTPVALPAFPNGAPEPRPKLPATVDLAPAEQFAQTLIGLDDVQWPQELKRLKSARGGLYTVALAWSIPRLEGARHKQARMTLAERLAYMTPATLRNHLRDPDPEIRRAAALACAMRADRSHIPDLIARITDPSDPAVQASRAGLRSLTGEDFGPDPGAADAAKLRAATDWQKWYETHQLPR